ncbi:hypothetical protein QJS04_geneDACA003609 [Acorus gramineus]|uniref:SWI/SNF-related matrix-associated actin-dependent regulator of chromatin subfamily A member 3-like 1 n=1 Tax=Acorus gramineus TaxID=55184 RepID=A0AAV9BQT0_ACOGR|nr:hypothetical protein QJS04_geneDACA003609 [Acorus gramineus]
MAAAASDDDDVTFPSQPPETYLAGFLIANIVGLRYYTGTISGREMVGLVREPLNPYDPNAIKVLNTRTVQVGHIERSVAAVLSPLIDSRSIAVEGIVPKPPSKNRNPFKLPCQIHVFTRLDMIDAVRSEIEFNGLNLISESDPEFGLSEAVIVQEGKPKKGSGYNIDRLFDSVEGEVRRRVAMEPPKEVVLKELFPHQKEGLGWMVSRENSVELPPFWKEEKDGFYSNVLTNFRTRDRPEPLRGGILADDMGLGKTLMLLSLIATNRPGSDLPPFVDVDDVEMEKTSNKRARGKGSRKKTSGSSKKRKIDDGFLRMEGLSDSGPRTTLVVCPPSVFSTWITQLEEHTCSGSLKVYLYHGERTKEVKELLKYDIVLTTYSTLGAEFNLSESPMKKIEWLRVILDEAHLIKNFAAQQTKAVIALKSERRWAVTGTPIQNSSFDLFSIMAFLRFEPFSIKSYWQSLVQRPLDQGGKSGLSRLQALMGAISLRRTKDSQADGKSLVGLPPKTVATCYVELSAEEREQYDHMESEAQNALRQYINDDTVMRNYSTVLHIILRLRQICNSVALCPEDIRSLLPSDTLEDVSGNPELLKKLVSMLEDGDDFDCPVCLCPPTKTVITCCAHIFCQACILRTLKQLNPRCPICRRPLSQSDLFTAPPSNPPDTEIPSSYSNRPISSKISALLKLLSKENPSTKSVVFSQFQKMLLLLEEPLKAAGFNVLRLDGSMTMKKRTDVIKEFMNTSDSTTVLLASLKASGAGINLTAASRVYLVDPWWNPAVEEQAMDRVHRIGQSEEVKVVRLVVKDSIEERILELQERKRKLASGVLGRKAGKELKQMRVKDLRTIMRM